MTTTSTALLEELLLEADQAAEPAGLGGRDDVVHKPDIGLPVPMVASEVTSAGHVYIYDTRTAERSVTNRNMLAIQLQKKRSDGSLVFSTVKPNFEPVRGTITCLLHADRPERAKYAAMGFGACPKSNIPSEHQLMMHMRHKHRVEFATIEEDQRRAEREEERAFQRSLIKLAARPSASLEVKPPRKRRTARTNE